MKVIDPSIKARVIELFQAKKEYKEIVQILKAEGINVSFGSCWNIVSKWKGSNKIDELKNQEIEPINPNYLGHSSYFRVGNIYRLPFENSTELILVLASGHIISRFVDKDRQECIQASEALQVNTGVSLDMNAASSPFCNAPTQSNGEGQAATNITSGVKSDSGVNSPTLAEPTFIISSEAQIEDIDFSDTPYAESYPKPNISDVNIINKDVESKDTSFEETAEDFNQPESNIPLRDIANGPTLGWNPDDSYEKRLWARIVDEKNQRQRELEIIRRERLMLEDEKQFRSNIEKFDGCTHCNSIISDDTSNNNKATTATARHLRYLHAYNERLERRLESITQTLRRLHPIGSTKRRPMPSKSTTTGQRPVVSLPTVLGG